MGQRLKLPPNHILNRPFINFQTNNKKQTKNLKRQNPSLDFPNDYSECPYDFKNIDELGDDRLVYEESLENY